MMQLPRIRTVFSFCWLNQKLGTDFEQDKQGWGRATQPACPELRRKDDLKTTYCTYVSYFHFPFQVPVWCSRIDFLAGWWGIGGHEGRQEEALRILPPGLRKAEPRQQHVRRPGYLAAVLCWLLVSGVVVVRHVQPRGLPCFGCAVSVAWRSEEGIIGEAQLCMHACMYAVRRGIGV